MRPNDDPDFHGENLRQYFQRLHLDRDGLCDQCSHAQKSSRFKASE
jgi:hypothetical protein